MLTGSQGLATGGPGRSLATSLRLRARVVRWDRRGLAPRFVTELSQYELTRLRQTQVFRQL
ncbi:hypothetical protein [Roseovarius sp. SYSU LYC5161]|uniref:hypothetical protein n=1 Tax=Roseovarius halophilus (ex Wu et al. 2025) TaxID=3376060 RepID=UPI00399BFB14